MSNLKMNLALAGLLNNIFLSSSVFLENSFAYRNDKSIQDFISTVVGWGNVELLLLFDLSLSLNRISHSRLLEKLEPILYEKYIWKLVSSFLTLPIIDKTGTDWSSKAGIPTLSFLSAILLNYYLDELDRAFEVHFPNFQYARYDYEVFIPIFIGKSKEFYVPNFLNLLNELDLVGKVTGIVPGGLPVDFFGGLVSVNKEGAIQRIKR